MTAFKFIFLLTFIVVNHETHAQAIEWSKTNKWRLYDVEERKGFQYSADTLKYFKSIGLGDSEVKEYLKKAVLLPKETSYAWMGLYVATCEIEPNKVKKIVFSTYGGFLYDPLTKYYYELPESLRKEWIDFLADKAAELTAK